MNPTKDYYQNFRSDMRQFLPNQYFKVLEIGCGEGYFRQNLENPCEYWGIEPNKEAVKVASQKLDKVLTGTFDETLDQVPDNYFDLVICCDVIEHMVDHDSFLKSIKSKMVDDGCLIGSIPNVRYVTNLFNFVFKKDWQYTKDGILDKTHLRFFTIRSLHRTLVNSNFEIEKYYGINPFKFQSVTKKLFGFFAVIVFGKDIKFLQHGFRIKLPKT